MRMYWNSDITYTVYEKDKRQMLYQKTEKVNSNDMKTIIDVITTLKKKYRFSDPVITIKIS